MFKLRNAFNRRSSIATGYPSPKATSPFCHPSSQQSPRPAVLDFPYFLLPNSRAGHWGAAPPVGAKTHIPEHSAVPPARQNPPPPPLRSGCGGRCRPASGPRQPCGPTLPPLLRTCQGHVSTLPNSEFLIMPNMLRLRRSGRTCGLEVAKVDRASGAAGRGLGCWGSAPRSGARRRAGRGTAGAAEEGPRSASAGPASSTESDRSGGPGKRFSRVRDLGNGNGELPTSRRPPLCPRLLLLSGTWTPNFQASDSSRAFLVLHS